MIGVAKPRIRPHVMPGSRTTPGLFGVMLPSLGHGVFGASSGFGQQQPTEWTPWGMFAPGSRPHRDLSHLGGPAGQVARSPGAFYTPPVTYQLTGIPGGDSFLAAAVPGLARPANGRTGTPPVAHMAINPFPSMRPPLPSYPAPAAWRGVF